MGHKQSKIQTLILFITTLSFILLLAISFWNISKDLKIGPWPLVFLILAILSATLQYYLYLQATNRKQIEDEIEEKVNKARAQIIQEFNTDTETEEVVEDEQNIDTAVNNLVPKGNFKTVDSLINKLLSNLSNEFQVVSGIYYTFNKQKKVFSMRSKFALQDDAKIPDFKLGENLNGQAAENKEIMLIDEIPEDYFTVESGLGKAKPKHLSIIPFIRNKTTIAVLEFATFIEMPADAGEILSRTAKLVEEKISQLEKS